MSNNSAIAVVENMVANGNFDVSIAREMIELQKEMMSHQAIINFNNDFSVMSNEIPIIHKSKSAHNTTYAPLEDIVSIVRPVLSKYGFSISFSNEQENSSEIKVICTLRHKDGHSTSTSLILPTQSVNKGMNPMQAIGAAVSYGKRYTLCSILNIATTGDDCNNGFAVNAKATRPLSDERLSKAIDAINGGDYTLEKLISAHDLTPEQLMRLGREVTKGE